MMWESYITMVALLNIHSRLKRYKNLKNRLWLAREPSTFVWTRPTGNSLFEHANPTLRRQRKNSRNIPVR